MIQWSWLVRAWHFLFLATYVIFWYCRKLHSNSNRFLAVFFQVRKRKLSRKRNTNYTLISQAKHTHTHTNTYISLLLHQLVKNTRIHISSKGEYKGTALARSVVVIYTSRDKHKILHLLVVFVFNGGWRHFNIYKSYRNVRLLRWRNTSVPVWTVTAHADTE